MDFDLPRLCQSHLIHTLVFLPFHLHTLSVCTRTNERETPHPTTHTLSTSHYTTNTSTANQQQRNSSTHPHSHTHPFHFIPCPSLLRPNASTDILFQVRPPVLVVVQYRLNRRRSAKPEGRATCLAARDTLVKRALRIMASQVTLPSLSLSLAFILCSLVSLLSPSPACDVGRRQDCLMMRMLCVCVREYLVALAPNNKT